MTLLDELERVTGQEHAALIAGDWRALEGCAAEKDRLADQAKAMPVTIFECPQGRKLLQSTRYNMELAASLSRQLSEVVTASQPRATYDQRGRVGRNNLAVMSLRG